MMPHHLARHPRYRHGITLSELLVLAVVTALCLGLLLLTLTQRRELVRQSVCKANLGAIGSAIYSYANENHDHWPVAAHPQAIEDRVSKVEYVRAIGSSRGRADNPLAGNTDRMSRPLEQLSTTRNLWTLFRMGLIERDKFICPSTTDSANQEPNGKAYWDFGAGDIDGPATPAQSRAGYSQVSYGYQMPYGKNGQPDADHDKAAAVADKGPFGAAIEGQAAPPPAAFPAGNGPGEWRSWNSPNHGYQGQNILYGGSWVDFQRVPFMGWGMDNIYTQIGAMPSSLPDKTLPMRQGNGPYPRGRLAPAPVDPRYAHFTYDSLIYP